MNFLSMYLWKLANPCRVGWKTGGEGKVDVAFPVQRKSKSEFPLLGTYVLM
jgi:hypothetical protein